MYVKDFTATGRSRRLSGFFSMCLLLVFLNGCGALRQKQVAPPPSKPTVGKPAEVPVPSGKKRPPVARPPVEERPVVGRPPIEERQIEERPIVIKPTVEERPVVTEPTVEERPTVTAPPVEEPPDVTDSPAPYKPVTGRAAGIYNEAEEAMQAGNFSSSEMLLERALRIEPRNAHYWYTLALAKFRQKQYPQAVQFCLKAESLAGSQPGLLARNRVLLTQAKKAAKME